jgi:hypothetical protein
LSPPARERLRPTSTDRVIGWRPFADGAGRPVYKDAAGGQYVIGPDGVPVCGQGLMPADEPVVVEAGKCPS